MTSEATAPLMITESAASRVRELIKTRGGADLKLRVFVQGGGCSGFEYGFQLDDVRAEDDTEVDAGGVSVLVDALSLQYLDGATIDFRNDLQGMRFVVTNPNASSTCGCGSSFAI